MVIEPRFRGGTSTAVVRQLAELVHVADVAVVGIRSRMFGDSPANPVLLAELERLGLDLEWSSDRVVADVIILHNPLFLKFQPDLGVRLVCRKLLVVTHENFLLPGGSEAFDVLKCLSAIERATICASRFLAPVSDRNRRIVQSWVEQTDADWNLAEQNWINICDNEIVAPTPFPRDRRGRHSRPGPEKFPSNDVLLSLFPSRAEYCGILGGDGLIGLGAPDHWDLIPFNGKPVAEFLGGFDFFVYFSNPRITESFGMVLAEAVSAGKLVITDPVSAETFGAGVIGLTVNEVDSCIARHVNDPGLYCAQVRKAQASLTAFSSERFRSTALALTSYGSS